MASTTRQLPLDLPPAVRVGVGDFISGEPNAAALAVIAHWADWPIGVYLLVGPAGAGKSHLAAIAAETTGARRIAYAALAGLDPVALAEAPALVIEDADALVGADREAADRALFHLLNAARVGERRVLVTAARPLAGWGIALADLVSRLRAATPLEIREPDDALLAAVMEKLCADRQLLVDPSVLAFCAARMERSFAAARALVAALDQLALAEKKPVTRSLAARALDALGFDRQMPLPGLEPDRAGGAD